VVRRIVRAHGGELQVHSEVGRGTTFEVRLPLASHAALAAPDVQVPDPRPAPS
jgi:signal transduction histidine kinase